jgi:AraC-like DNA-binding protein
MGMSSFVSSEESALRVQLFAHDASIAFPQHVHNETSIVICTDGSLESTQFGHREVLREGDVVITNREIPHSSHYVFDGKPTRGVTIDVSRFAFRHLVDGGVDSQLANARFLGKLHIPEVGRIATEIEAEHANCRPGNKVMIDALSRLLVVRVLRSWPKELVQLHEVESSPQLPRHELVRSIEWMNEVPLSVFGVNQLARQVNRSSSVFSRLFVRSTGESPHRFYSRMMMIRASQMLAHSDRSVKDIALSLGFRSLSHFSSAFRATHYMSPSEYRLQLNAAA